MISFQECYINGVIPYIIFWDWLFSLSIISWRFPRLLHVPIVGSFLLRSNIPWYGYTIVCLIIPPLKDIWAVSDLGYYEQSCYKHFFRGFYVKVTFHFCGKMPRSVTARLYSNYMFCVLKKLPYYLTEWLYHLSISPARYKWFSSSTPSPMFGVLTNFFLNFNLFNRYVVISHLFAFLQWSIMLNIFSRA